MTKTEYTVAEAAEKIGKNRTTVDRHLKAGKLTFNLNSDGVKVIQGAELARAYNLKPEDLMETAESAAKHKSTGNSDVKKLQEQLLEEYQDRIKKLESTNERLQATLAKALDIPPLLEDRRAKDDAWQATLDATIAKVTDQTEKQIATLQQQRKHHEKELAILKRALLAERKNNRSFWQKLFA